MTAGKREQTSIQGCLLELGDGHEVAIYLRDGVPSVAEFRDGAAEICAASAWMTVNGRRLVGAQRRGEVEPGSPIPPGVAKRIERLHRDAEESRSHAIVRAFALIVGARPAGSAGSLT